MVVDKSKNKMVSSSNI